MVPHASARAQAERPGFPGIVRIVSGTLPPDAPSAQGAAAETDDSGEFALLLAWRAGDEAAAGQLFGRHYASVHAFFARRIAEAADDLTQRTFLACVEAAASFRGEARFRGFVFGIARNQLLKHLRSRARFHAMLERAVDDDLTRTSPSALVGRRQEQHLLLLAFARLPGDLQLTVEFFYWQGLGTGDIAAAMAVPVSTVTTRLSRARELLREYVGELGGPLPPREALLSDLDGWTRSLADAHVVTPRR
jgi:RNA polymerase sigma factor (sigma-70 family)